MVGKAAAESPIIKDSELDNYLTKQVAEGREVRYIDAEGNTTSWTPKSR